MIITRLRQTALTKKVDKNDCFKFKPDEESKTVDV